MPKYKPFVESLASTMSFLIIRCMIEAEDQEANRSIIKYFIDKNSGNVANYLEAVDIDGLDELDDDDFSNLSDIVKSESFNTTVYDIVNMYFTVCTAGDKCKKYVDKSVEIRKQVERRIDAIIKHKPKKHSRKELVDYIKDKTKVLETDIREIESRMASINKSVDNANACMIMSGMLNDPTIVLKLAQIHDMYKKVQSMISNQLLTNEMGLILID